MTNRTFQVIIGNHRSKTVSEETGVPQGSVIAVTLFLVAMDGVFSVLPKGIFIFVYADDILLVSTGKYPKVVLKKLQAAVNAVVKWTDMTGFDISPEKCVRMHICTKKHLPPRQSISIKGKPIPTRRTTKILGITFDRHLSFRAHFDDIKKSCRNRINLLKILSNKRTRSDRRSRLRVADAIICSRLLYGVEITCRASNELIDILSPTYNNAIRAISGLLPSTPAKATCVEAGVMPFIYKVAIAIGSKAVSFLERTEGDGSPAFLATEADRILNSVAGVTLPPVAGLHRLGPRSWLARDPQVDNYIKHRVKRGSNPTVAKALFNERITTNYAETEIIYTDGSKLSNTVGIGIYGKDFDEYYSLPNSASVFSAEAAAIHKAASHSTTKPMLIVTDSASCILAITSPKTRHPWIQATQTLLETRRTPSISFMWVPGHSNILGNESADRLANLGRTGRCLTMEVPAADVKSWLKTVVRDAWSKDWWTDRTLFIRKVKGNIFPWEDRIDRKEQLVLSRLRTGHTKASHNMEGGANFRKVCDSCGTPNTVEHMLCVCPVLELPRTLHGLGDIQTTLSNDSAMEAALICFLKDTKLFSSI